MHLQDDNRNRLSIPRFFVFLTNNDYELSVTCLRITSNKHEDHISAK